MTRPMTLTFLLLLALALSGWAWSPDLPRAELEARYAAPPSTFVDAAGLRLHVRDSGPRNAPALLLLHGFGSSLHTWDDWAAGLDGQWRVVRVDLPGAGLTGADPTADYSDERGIQVLAALLDQLGIARATVIGHSMGGRLAWRLAAEQPARVERLVLIAPDGFASPGFAYGKAPDVGLTVRLMQHVLPRPLVRASLLPAYSDRSKATDAMVDRYHAMLLAPGVRGALVARLQQLVLQEPTPWLQRIAAPTLLLWGEQDAMIPALNAQDYLRTVPGSRLVTLPGVGHLPHEEAPQASLPVLRTFLAP
ncbi:MAG: alpha/beta fold hydrolase [Rubrivivax sp.]|nr:alpha/beta fold hydrolase [Rubrivivax sp.]